MKDHWFKHIYTRYGVFVKWIGLGAGIAAFLMMFLIFADIIGRKFFNSPVEGAYEITESLLTFIIFFGVAYTQLERSHVRVTYGILPSYSSNLLEPLDSSMPQILEQASHSFDYCWKPV